MPIKRERVWIRIAGNAKRIKAGEKEGWRCFVSDTPIIVPSINDEIPLVDWKISGNAIPNVNFIPGTFKFEKPTDEPVLVAWIDILGNISIEEGVARIELLFL